MERTYQNPNTPAEGDPLTPGYGGEPEIAGTGRRGAAIKYLLLIGTIATVLMLFAGYRALHGLPVDGGGNGNDASLRAGKRNLELQPVSVFRDRENAIREREEAERRAEEARLAAEQLAKTRTELENKGRELRDAIARLKALQDLQARLAQASPSGKVPAEQVQWLQSLNSEQQERLLALAPEDQELLMGLDPDERSRLLGLMPEEFAAEIERIRKEQEEARAREAAIPTADEADPGEVGGNDPSPEEPVAATDGDARPGQAESQTQAGGREPAPGEASSTEPTDVDARPTNEENGRSLDATKPEEPSRDVQHGSAQEKASGAQAVTTDAVAVSSDAEEVSTGAVAVSTDRQGVTGKAGHRPEREDDSGAPELTLEEQKFSAPMMGTTGTVRTASASGTSESRSGATERTGGSQGKLGSLLAATPTPARSAGHMGDMSLKLPRGTFIDCILETAINTSVPGMTTCILPRDIYSGNGRVLLLERGSKAVGEYRGAVENGMARIFLLWTQIRTPRGVFIDLDSPATDPVGGSGVDGYVDYHWWARFGNALLFSLVADSFDFAITRAQETGDGNYYSNTEDGMDEIISEILRQSGNIPPTLTKNQGERIGILVARDLDFSDVYELKTAPLPEVGADTLYRTNVSCARKGDCREVRLKITATPVDAAEGAVCDSVAEVSQ